MTPVIFQSIGESLLVPSGGTNCELFYLMIRILLTGAGGAAAVSFMKAVRHLDVEIHAADRDALAAGLYLVPRAQRVVIPDAALATFARQVLYECCERQIDVVVPTVDAELESLAAVGKEFALRGVALMLASSYTLRCLDKWELLRMCRTCATLPRTELLNSSFSVSTWTYPCVVKPRRGSGGRGVRIVHSDRELQGMDTNSDLLVQEYLPGQEYSVDVLADLTGAVIASVPRERMKVDSGIAVASRTVKDRALMLAATRVARAIGLRYMANIQFKRRRDGTPVLLEVNPRFPGTMPLTVMAGVNMPELCLRYALGMPVELPVAEFREIAVVRYWQEQFIGPCEMDELELSCGANWVESEVSNAQFGGVKG